MSNFIDRFRLTDKVAIVTGAGRGIGKAIALAMAELGAHVVYAERSASTFGDTADLIRERGRRALAVACDVTQEDQLEQLVNAAVKEFGRIDILVNSATSFFPTPALNISAADFEHALRINLTSPFLLTKLVVPIMAKTAGEGSVINISSIGSLVQLKGFSSYGAAKAGLNQLTNILAAEFAPKIRVNGIIVGSVETPGSAETSAYVASVMAKSAPNSGLPAMSDEEKRKLADSMVPMRRRGRPDDIAAGVVFLASPAAAWITGTMLHINGGASNPSLGGGGGLPIPEL